MNIVGLYRSNEFKETWCRISHHPSGDYYVEWSNLGPEVRTHHKIKILVKDLHEANYIRDESEAVAEILKTYKES